MSDTDNEITAMSSIAKILEELSDKNTRTRIIKWIVEKFEVDFSEVALKEYTNLGSSGNNTDSALTFDEFVDLYNKVNPTSDIEKAITAGYWFQVIQGELIWGSNKVNNALKNTGNGVGRIDRALSAAEKEKPSLVRQIRKNGKNKQSKKSYKLTTSGIELINKRISQ